MNPERWYQPQPTPHWSFLDTVNWAAIRAHEAKFYDMPKIGSPPITTTPTIQGVKPCG